MKTLLRENSSSGIPIVAFMTLVMVGCSNAENNGAGMEDRRAGNHENAMADTENYDAPADQVTVHFDTRLYTEDGGLIIRKEANTREPATTPAEERSYMEEDLHRIRLPLMAELGRVRDRLNLGDRPETAMTADQKRAAELEQSLERVERILAVIEAGTDSTWKTEREHQLKELKDVHEWVMRYRAVRPTSSTSRM